MPQVNAELPHELLSVIDNAAQDFDTSRDEIIRRALEHYAQHVVEVMTAPDRPQPARPVSVDWAAAKQVFQDSKCPYDECPFAGDCPVELCPL